MAATNTTLQNLNPSSALGRTVGAVLKTWPEHEKFLTTSFAVRDSASLAHGQEVAEMIERLCGGRLDALCHGYRWMCDMVREEDLYFRRHHKYRLSSFAEANEAVYANGEVMDQYMKGLLLSQLMWSNHAAVLNFFITQFLGLMRRGSKLLEVGPGHGLLLALAAKYAECSELVGWDVSAVSLNHTANCLNQLGAAATARLEKHNVLDGSPLPREFDGVILSEVCEHLEQPLVALRALRGVLTAGGRIFVNMPINAPAIDHIYLLTNPEAVVEMIREAGFNIEATCFAPASGYSEADARKRNIPISVAVIGVAQ